MGRTFPDNLLNSILRVLILNDSDGAAEHNPRQFAQKGGVRSCAHGTGALQIYD